MDHGPLLEKAFAERAGLGWIGKHSNVIATRGSSWFFLGEILLPVGLPPDDPHPNRCGSCTRCMGRLPYRSDHRALCGGQPALHLPI